MVNVRITNTDVITFLKQYTGPKFSFALYDPPYEMNIIGNDWDKSGVVFSKEYNELLFDSMKPGAFVLCYGHSRIFHRVMVALEDAGFIINKAIFGWGYSSGSPQGAANLQRNIDNYWAKQYGGLCDCEYPGKGRIHTSSGHIRPDFKNIALPVEVCTNCGKPIRQILSIKKWHDGSGKKGLGGSGYGNNNEQIIAGSMTVEAELLKDYSYGLAAIKPMVEPIIMVQKPFEGSAVQSITKYGTGVINVHNTRYIDRWPGNFVGVHNLGCVLDDNGGWQCVDECEIGEEIRNDPTFAERFPTFSYNEIDMSLSSIDSMVIQSKPNSKEKADNPHITIKPVKLNQYLGRLFLPPDEFGIATAFVPYSGSGSEIIGLVGAGWMDITAVEADETYAKYSVKRINSHVMDGNIRYDKL